MALPKVLYIYEDKETDGTAYYVAEKDIAAQMEGVVGVYRLDETFHVRHKPQLRRKGTTRWFDKA